MLNRLETARLRLKQNKCKLLSPSVEYLGHRISIKGLQPIDEKVRAIEKSPTPSNVFQLRSFIGLVNCYCKFLPNLANTLPPLYSLFIKTRSGNGHQIRRRHLTKQSVSLLLKACWSTMSQVRSYCYHVMPLHMA